MCVFLGVAPMGVEVLPRDGTSKGVRSTVVQVAERKLLRPAVRRQVPAAMLALAVIRWNKAPRPTLRPETKAALMERFAPDLAQLGTWSVSTPTVEAANLPKMTKQTGGRR